MITEALRLLDLFASVGVERFDITHTNIDQEKRGFRSGQTLRQVKNSMPHLAKSAAIRQNNVIVRPHNPPADILVQLDDLTPEDLERARPAAFLILRTSEKGYQAWIAVADTPRGDETEKRAAKDFASRLRRGAGADLSASGATRVAGLANYKRAYAPHFPIVTIEEARPGHRMTMAQLESMGLVAAPEPAKEASASPLRCSTRRPRRRAWPSYEKCLDGAPESPGGGKQRTRADFTFACIAADWGWSPPEIAAKLLEVSSKARENGETYALQQATNAAGRVTENPRRQGRQR